MIVVVDLYISLCVISVTQPQEIFPEESLLLYFFDISGNPSSISFLLTIVNHTMQILKRRGVKISVTRKYRGGPCVQFYSRASRFNLFIINFHSDHDVP